MASDVNWEAEKIRLNDDYDLRQLPYQPLCNKLVELIMRGPSLSVIPDTFFKDMPVLKVLDLSYTNIKSLPRSISSLRMLEEFFLEGCSALMEIPTQIGMLSKLKLFDINGTELMFIPKEMGKLEELEVLRVSLSQYAKHYIETKRVQRTVIPRNVISSLKKLKELCFRINVGKEPDWWEGEVKYLQNELCDLENLETLAWNLPTHEALEEFLRLGINYVPIYARLSNMMLTIGQHPQLTFSLPHGLEKKFLEFKNCLNWINYAEGKEHDISKITARVEALFLHHHQNIKNLSTFYVSNLKYCLVAECNEMETLFGADDLSTEVGIDENLGFELLEYLSIHHMNTLQSIWKGPIGKNSLSKLRVLALHTCREMTSVFTLVVAKSLLCLTELIVEDCPQVKTIIESGSKNVEDVAIFPNLDRVFLLNLPELKAITDPVIFKKLSTLLIYNCQKLGYISSTELPNIKNIKAEIDWWKDLEFSHIAEWKNIFKPLEKGRELVEQLSEATNSLQHFHDTIPYE